MWSRIKIIKVYTFTLMKEVEHMKKELHPDYHKVFFFIKVQIKSFFTVLQKPLVKQWNGKMATATLLFVLKLVQTHTHFILVSKKQTVLVAVSIDSRKNITCNNESGTCSLIFYL